MCTRLRADRSLEAGARFGAAADPARIVELRRDNGEEAARADEARGAAWREKPLNGTSPGHGSGTKQAPEPARGGNRREAANACGRHVVRLGMPRGQWTRAGEVVKRAETLAGPPVPKGTGRAAHEGALKRRHETWRDETRRSNVWRTAEWREVRRAAWKQAAATSRGEPDEPRPTRSTTPRAKAGVEPHERRRSVIR